MIIEKYLSIIFGTNVGPIYLGSFANPILQTIFEKFNIVILSMGLIIVSYTAFVSTINTAQDGQILGKKWSSIWLPMRAVLGLAILVPISGSGYSLIQTMTLWLIMQASGYANKTWELIIDYLEQGITISSSISLENTDKDKLKIQGRELGTQLLRSAICISSLQNIANKLAIDQHHEIVPASDFVNKNAQFLGSYQTNPVLNIRTAQNLKNPEYTANFNIGVKSANTGTAASNEYAELCGSLIISAKVDQNEVSKDQDSKALALDALQKKLLATNTIFSLMRQLAPSLLTNTIADRPNQTAIYTINDALNIAEDVYVGLLSNLIKKTRNNRTAESLKLYNSDWTAVGLLYLMLDNSKNVTLLNTATTEPVLVKTLNNSTIKTIPSCTTQALEQQGDYREIRELGYLPKYLVTAEEIAYICRQLNLTADIAPAPNNINIPPSPEQNIIASNQFNTAVADAFVLLEHELKKNPNGNPIKPQSEFGKALLKIADPKLQQNDQVTDSTVVNIMHAVLWFCGAALVFYVPLIPCLIYTVAVLGWFILVVENFFILPIAALGFIVPGREELGNIGPNVGLLLNTLLRPILMVINFILAIRVYKVAVEFINSLMANQVATLFNANISFLAPLVAIVIYVILILISANMCFSLLYKIPNKITDSLQKLFGNQQISVAMMQTLTAGKAPNSISTIAAPAASNANSSSGATSSNTANSNPKRTDPSGIS